jgi:hypothetical protein
MAAHATIAPTPATALRTRTTTVTNQPMRNEPNPESDHDLPLAAPRRVASGAERQALRRGGEESAEAPLFALVLLWDGCRVLLLPICSSRPSLFVLLHLHLPEGALTTLETSAVLPSVLPKAVNTDLEPTLVASVIAEVRWDLLLTVLARDRTWKSHSHVLLPRTHQLSSPPQRTGKTCQDDPAGLLKSMVRTTATPPRQAFSLPDRPFSSLANR